jgi:hypothetical protein
MLIKQEVKMTKRGIISILVVSLFVFGMAAAASADVVSLKAKVPEGKDLKAYKFTVTYDAAKVKLVETKAANKDFATTINDTAAGTIVVNAFSVNGVKGKSTVSVIDITVEGSAKDANFGVTVDDFGTAEDRFEGEAEPEFAIQE